MFKKWFGRVSPFVILSVVAVFFILYQLISTLGGAPEWTRPLVLRVLGLLIFMVITDLALKHFIKKNLFLWILEIMVSLALVYYWIVT